MALTTFVKGRAYDWSYAIGRGAANGTGFNYPQTMCLGNESDLFVANRGNENNFRDAGEPDQDGWSRGRGTARRVLHIRRRTRASACGPSASRSTRTTTFTCRMSGRTPFRCSIRAANSFAAGERPGSGPGQLKGPAGLVCESNGNIIVVDSGNDRLQVFTPEGKFWRSVGTAAAATANSARPWGITLDKDSNIWVADWKNHRVQKWSPGGKYLKSIGQYGTIPAAPNAFAVTYLGPYISSVPESRVSESRRAQSSHRRRGGSRWRHLRQPIGATIGFASSTPRVRR